MVKYLALDLDGTLFYPKGRKHFISKKNLAFLRQFVDAGNKLILVTSRQPDFVEHIVELIDRDCDYICLCGAVVKHDGKIVKNETIPNDVLMDILEQVKEKYKPFGYFLTCEGSPVIVCPLIHIGLILRKFYLWVYKSILGIYREEIVISEEQFYEKLKTSHIYNIKSFYGMGKKVKENNKKINTAIREKYPSIESSWMGIVLEFTPKGCNKGDSLTEYIEDLGIDKNQVYVVGDSGNDISMFNAFHENSYVMKHAYPSVKKYAKHRISRVYKMEKYLFERSQNE